MALTYGQVAETLTGISLSIAGDMMLFGTGKTASAHLEEMVTKMHESEARHRGIPAEDIFNNSPDEMFVSDEAEKIWHDYLSALDKSGEDENED